MTGMIALMTVLLAQADAGAPPAPPRVRSWKDAAKELHAPAPAPPARADEKLPRVLVYGAQWCGPCHKLQAWLREQQVEFGYVDIDRNSIGVKRLNKLRREQGIKNGNIPVIEIDGALFEGFNPQKLEAALDEHKIPH